MLTDALPDETTVLNFRRLLETHRLAPKLLEAVNAHLTEKGLLLRYLGMKVQIGVRW